MLGKIAGGLRYAKKEIQENGDNPVWWRDRVNHRINSPVQQAVYGDQGIDVMAADWDNLLVLDAARADLFEEALETNAFDEYRRVKSRGSATGEWCRSNFPDRYGDTVFVSGNPMPSRHVPGSFHEFVEVWQEGFDDDIGTIRADVVADRARDTHERHPNKRLIVHFMQPHYPFVRDDQLEFSYWEGTEGIELDADDRADDVWEAVGRGLAEPDEVWEAYRENLAYVMEHVWDLIDDLEGKTVIHADHGNALGARSWPVPIRTYGHPPGLRLSDLVTVPWAVIEGKRRTIHDHGAGEEGEETSQMNEKLRALGYVEK